MEKTDYMRRAIDLARAKMQEGYWPFGCVIVRDGEVVGEGCNDMPITNDPTGHGEIVAIRDACKRLGALDLSGCDLYTSLEPCSLCASAIWLTRIRSVNYAAALEETLMYGADFSRLPKDIGLPIHERSTPSEQVLAREGHILLEEWAAIVRVDPALQRAMSRGGGPA